MNHVIEHLPDPFTTLSRLVARLEPGGWLEGQTPAAQSLEHHVFGQYSSGYHAPRHTVVFSRAACGGSSSASASARSRFRRHSIQRRSRSASPRWRDGGTPTRGFDVPGYVGCAGSRSQRYSAPIDLASGSPGIVNFKGVKR